MRALRLPEDAPEDAQPGCSLPAWAVGALPNPWLQRHYQARPMRCFRTWHFDPSSTQTDEECSHKLVKVLAAMLASLPSMQCWAHHHRVA